MNRAVKEIVDIAFRTVAWNNANEVARAERKRPTPMPFVVVDFMRLIAGMKEVPAGVSIFDVADKEQRSTITRVGAALGRFADGGFPIVSLDEETAMAFASTPPPSDGVVREWPLSNAYALCIGEGAALVRHGCVDRGLPDSMRPHFTIVDGIVEMDFWSTPMDWLAQPDGVANLVDAIGLAIAHRPEGMTVTERHPSRQAARKQGLNPAQTPAVEYVIGAEVALHGRPARASVDEGASGRKLKVRTVVSPHWTHQPCGPQRSERRLQWIASHWKGPEGAPISVHAMRIVKDKPPARGRAS